MPRTKFHKGFSDSNGNTSLGSDGSFERGKAHKAYLDSKVKSEFDKSFEKAKAVLKDKTARLTVNGEQLAIQWTTYLNWDDTPLLEGRRVKKTLQSLTGAKFGLNSESVDRALKIALELNDRLQGNTFSWVQYPQWIPDEHRPKEWVLKTKTIGEWIEEFKKHYEATHDMSLYKSTINFEGNYLSILKQFPKDKPMTDELLIERINGIKQANKNPRQLLVYLKAFCTFIGYEFDWKKYVDRTKPTESKRIDLSDNQIEDFILNKLKPQERKGGIKEQFDLNIWMLKMMAAYGLRNHEVFNILNLTEDYKDPKTGYIIPAFTNSKNEQGVIVVTGKTGLRVQALPLPHKWLDLFELRKLPEFPDWYCLPIRSFERDKRIKAKIKNINLWLIRKKVADFTPYNLRHAYAMRARKLNINPLDVADFMGHSLEMHSNIYNAAISYESLINNAANIINKVENEETELEKMRAEIAKLRLEVAELKAENNRLRLEQQWKQS